MADNTTIQFYGSKIRNCVVFKIKTDYGLEFVPKENMRLLDSTKEDNDKDKCYRCTVTLLIIVIRKHQKCYLGLYQINSWKN